MSRVDREGPAGQDARAMEAAATAAGEGRRVLRELFGFADFMPHQAEVVDAILAGRDALVVMPTGGGKSLCYQLPARMLPGTCLVISPLISLMKDQVDAAATTGLRAAFLNSSLTAEARRGVEAKLADGALDLLYVSPERFAMPDFLARLRRARLSFAAVDEAHCISEWGHDFRPDYLDLARLVTDFPRLPVAAFTATATARVQDDIVARLGLRDPYRVRASFNRPNLFYRVVPKDRPTDQVFRFVQARPGEAGIVYRTTRRDVERTAAALARHGVRALPYHAGLDDEVRRRHQEAFNRDAADVIVATIAFGMGIDKSNVRYVVHGDLPKNIEGYYQETGRAGRDGEPAHCLLLFGYGDLARIRHFIDPIPDEAERARALAMLREMVRFATTFACRRRRLLAYFGETLDAAPHPGCCDVCAGEVERIDATREAQMVLSAIARTGGRFGIGHILAIVTGEATERVCRLGHDRLPTFGVGRDHDRRHWRLVVDNLLAQELVRQTDGEYPVLELEPAARGVLFGGEPVSILRTRRAPAARRRRAAAATDEAPYDEALFERLRTLRRALADEQGVPSYVVFNDRTLREMARTRPTTEAALLEVSGVGAARLARYGAAFLAAIREAEGGARGGAVNGDQ